MSDPAPAAEAGARNRRAFDAESQELYLVLGGHVTDPQGSEFSDPATLDLRGVYASYATAFEAWRSAAQATVDDAMMKYVIARLR